MLTVNSLPCIYLHIKYDEQINTYTYLEVNEYYSNLFNLDPIIFENKYVGFLDSLEFSVYNDIHLLVFLTTLSKKDSYTSTINLIVKQTNITENINDNVSLLLFGKNIKDNEYFLVGYKDNNLFTNILEPTPDRILDNLPIYIYWKDFNGKYLGNNNSLAAYLAVDEPVYSSLIKTDTTISYRKYCDNIITTTRTPLTSIIETHLIAPEGKRIHVKANKIPIIVHDFIVSILYTFEDVTELIEQLNVLNETKELLQLKEQQYQDLLDKVNKNNNLDTNNLFNNLLNKNNDSEKELLQLELLLNKIEEQVKLLYEKVYTSDNSLVSELSRLKQNQEEDVRNFAANTIRLNEVDNKITNIQSSINFLLFFKNLTAKQLLLFGLVLSVLFTYVGKKVDSNFIKKIIENTEKVLD